MKLKYILSTLAALLLLAACEDEKHDPIVEITGFAELFATIGEAEEVQTRADETDYNTYSAFTSGDQIGLFATAPLRKYNSESPDITDLPAVENSKFQLYTTSTSTRWGDDTGKPILKWDTSDGKSADIYAYYPYQENYNNNHDNNGNYSIFENSDNNEGQLADVLVAQRTTVENNNPAIFLTFKHRFALLHLSLGTGMAAVTENDNISAITTAGIAADATLRLEDFVVQLKEGVISQFIATRSGTDYYIILPAGKVAGDATDSLQVEQIMIENATSDLGVPITMQPNMIYHMTIHKHEGSITFEENGIEIWGGNQDLGGIREEPGIYWASDMRNLIIQYNLNPSKENLSLEAYGTWDDDNSLWVFNLMRHIDINDITWEDKSFESFHGIFNGNGYSITGLDITDGYGLFDEVIYGSVISDLTLVNISVNGEAHAAGALAGTVAEGVTIHNCHITGNSVVNGGGSTGGLIGSSDGTITRCSSAAEVNATDGGVGGLVGVCSGTLEDSYATGRVTATGDDVGGLVGSGGTIKNCYAAGSVTGANYVGGLAGTAGNVDNCYAVGDINGILNVGGLIGSSSGEVKDSSSGGTVTAKDIAGGLIGSASSIITLSSSASNVIAEGSKVGGLVGELVSGSIANSHATGEITASGSMVGGLAGYTEFEIINSYAVCNVTGQDYVGGLVGQTTANVENCKAEGDIKGVENVGGLIGETSGNVWYSSSGGTVTGEGITGGLIGKLNTYSEVNYSYSRSVVSTTSGAVGGLIGQAPVATTKETPINQPENPDEGENGGTRSDETGGTEPDPDPEPEPDPEPDPDPEPECITEYVSGPKITYCYATNGLPLMGSGGWIEYSYDTGNMTVKEGMSIYYYSIDLSYITEEGINTLLEGLNSGNSEATPDWEIDTVIIGEIEYSLPVLTSNK